MKRPTILAAVTAVGLMTFAAHSQEAPLSAATGDAGALAGRKDTAKMAPAPFLDRGQVQAVVPQAAPAARSAEKAKEGKASVEVVATARKTTIVNSSEKAAVAKAGKPVSGGKYYEIIARYAGAYGVPASLANAIVRFESNYRANARGRAGEIGLMQIKHSTARGMGYTGSAKGLYDPETNIKYGMKYLAAAHKLGGGTTCGAILRYNAGHGAKRMNPTSAAYCSRVKRLLGSS